MSDINYNNTGRKPEKQKSSQSFFSQKFGAATEVVEEAPQVKVRLNPGQEDELTVWGYRQHLGRLLATLLAVLLTAGVLGLVLYWMKHWWLRLTQVKCSLEQATSVLIVVRI